MHKILKVGFAGIILSLSSTHALVAAQPAVENFGSGANGWVGTSGFGFGTWSFTEGAARVSFINPGIGLPDLCTLSNLPGATSGSFTGNYDTAEIDVIGFSFMAPNYLPTASLVEFEFGGSTSVYRRSFSITQTGIWYNCVASLLNEDMSQWSVHKGSLTDFAAARQSVGHISIRLSRSLTNAHHFVIDNIFVAGMPGGASVTHDTTGQIEWDGLLAGIGYQVQSTTNLIAAPWVSVESLIATGTLHSTIITNTTREIEAYRIHFQE